MRKFLLLLILSLCGGVFVSANNPSPPAPEENQKPYDTQSFCERLTNLHNKDLDTKFEIRLSWIGDIDFPYYLRPKNPQDYWSTLGEEYHQTLEKEGNTITYVSPQLGFMLHLTKRISLELGLFYANQRQNVYNTVTSQVSRALRTDIFTLKPTAKWDVIRSEWFRFYLSAGINIYFTNDKYGGAYYDGEIFTGYGYTIGKRIFYFMEGNYGGYGASTFMGIGYRF